MKFIPALIALLLFTTNCRSQADSVVGPLDFQKGIRDTASVQVLDVRTPGEYKTGHLPHALLADWKTPEEFRRRIAFLDKSKPLYVYCLVGGRSAAAASLLREQGYSNVVELKGGINAWKAAGLDLEDKQTQPQMTIAAFENAIAGPGNVLVDFGAGWCPPCRAMEPEMATLQTKHKDKFRLVKVDGGRDEELVKKFQVTTLPVFILFRDGKPVWRKDGVTTAAEIATRL